MKKDGSSMMTKIVIAAMTAATLIALAMFNGFTPGQTLRADTNEFEFDAFLLGGSPLRIQMDFFCDGYEFTRVPGTPLFNVATCGCTPFTSIATLGGTAPNRALHMHPNETEAGGIFQLVFNEDRTVQIYDSNGLIAEDTWSGGCPGPSPGERPSWFDK